MSFFETPVRRRCVVRACGALVLALAIGALGFMPTIDTFGRVFTLGLAGLCVLMALLNFWWARRASPSATLTPIPNRAPVPAQVRYYRRLLWFSVIAFPVMIAWIAYDLNQLEAGTTKDVAIWAPLVPIYDNFGYWPTLAILAGIGMVCCLVPIHKLKQLKRTDQRP